ncbi:hypothetical protein ACFQFC_39700 [Amorphoplanes digitatis]|uniref:Uncharacterized protein n=1 Tax=Actinoplanes digitatis TaxID=1868 RepID=A0A7W7HX20_9ACTN|nr:hypothetical protein [Actinoplanes digitatis]MBB4762299.1 hypothetical protein [Actinoplanes digitatis]GID92579.1 hypothetical protein Adi01nite_19910 [Actinoplanes digitatis]
MITKFLAAAGRHGRPILATGLALSAGFLLVQAQVPALGQRAFPALMIAAMSLLPLGVVSVAGRRPNAFVVLPDVPAFSTPPRPTYTFLALAYLVMATGRTANVIRDWGSDPFLSEQLPELFTTALTLLFVAVAWGDNSVQLRPDGVWQRGLTGWLVIPWDASPAVPSLPPAPNANTVPLTCARPELVRRSGLHVFGKKLRTTDIEPWLITAAIRYYAANPVHRPAIGTEIERDRLMRELFDPFRPAPAAGT